VIKVGGSAGLQSDSEAKTQDRNTIQTNGGQKDRRVPSTRQPELKVSMWALVRRIKKKMKTV